MGSRAGHDGLALEVVIVIVFAPGPVVGVGRALDALEGAVEGLDGLVVLLLRDLLVDFFLGGGSWARGRRERVTEADGRRETGFAEEGEDGGVFAFFGDAC